MNKKIIYILYCVLSLFSITVLPVAKSISINETNEKTPSDLLVSLCKTVTLYPVGDALVDSQRPNTNYGNSSILLVVDYPSWLARSYLQFDISSVPSNATIFDAELSLFFWNWDDMNTSQIGVYRVASYPPWNENTITWNNQPQVISYYFEDAIWLGAATNSYVSWNITNLTQGWINGTVQNLGVVIKCVLETNGIPMKMKMFRSKEWTNVAEWPKLTITYNTPPIKPVKPVGPSSGRVGITYTYSSTTVDLEGDDLFYLFDWGDGTNSGWLGPYVSGSPVTASHTWTTIGSYNIKVKAKDIHNAESPWSDPLLVSMPRNWIVRNTLLITLLKNIYTRFSELLT